MSAATAKVLAFPTPERATVKDSAKLLKATLRAAFPATAFSVTMSRGTGYGSVHVQWTDGPTTTRVKAITDSFEGEGFDGMTDSSYQKNNVMPNGQRTGLKFVLTERRISPDFARRCAAQVAHYFGIPAPELTITEGHDGRPSWHMGSGIDAMRVKAFGEYWSTMIHRASCDATRYSRGN